MLDELLVVVDTKIVFIIDIYTGAQQKMGINIPTTMKAAATRIEEEDEEK